MGEEAYLHFPTLLDWIEHAAAFGGAFALGWWARWQFIRRRSGTVTYTQVIDDD